jgi:hypothetical protein
MGIEPTLFAWEAKVLPLNDARETVADSTVRTLSNEHRRVAGRESGTNPVMQCRYHPFVSMNCFTLSATSTEPSLRRWISSERSELGTTSFWKSITSCGLFGL